MRNRLFTQLHTLLLVASGLACSFQVVGQSYWKPWTDQGFAARGVRYIQPKKYHTSELSVPEIRSVLSQAPLEFTAAAKGKTVLLHLPNPDGEMETFRIFESPVMHQDLQAKYPEIRTYSGYNVARPNESLKCDLTPKGFHAMVLGAANGQWFIDPYSHDDSDHYVVHSKKAGKVGSQSWNCTVDHDELNQNEASNSNAPDYVGDCMLRTYRLALACTGEYATFHGGTVALALAAMNTSMNRINGVYERELAIRMIIIPNNDLIIYLNASSDPYANTNGSTMLGQNQTTLTNVIGAANYDIGHVFSTGGGGIASLASVCSANNKARGVTGAGQPIGDAFDIDYVAHEMGHQFGGNHTFYNSCGGNKSAASAFEPGSGATIMGYAGICPPDVQNNSDDYFHARSLQEMGTFSTSGGGNSCAVKATLNNTQPSVEAGANYTIPISTPFALTAAGNDNDVANVLTYCWEQMNNDGTFTQPPAATNAGGPMFRSLDPVPSPTRFFPPLTNVINGTANTWQVLPSVNRTLNFRVTVRDNAIGGGCTAEDNMVVTVSSASGPFVVTAPNTNVLWNVGEMQTVTWNVANTNLTPVNCTQVKISLSIDGGLTYPIVLADGVDNSGTAMVSVPNNVSTTCRVKVEGRGNIFYDISNVNFRIQAPAVPTFVLTSSLPQNTVCAGESFSFAVDATSLLGFNTPIQLSISGLPQSVSASFSSNPLTPTGQATVSLTGFSAANAGNITFTVTGVAGSITQNTSQTITLLPGAPGSTSLSSPVHQATGVKTNTGLSWAPVSTATMYRLQVATSPAFAAGEIIKDTVVSTASAGVSNLAQNTVYFWRVLASNPCGTASFTVPFSFQTAGCSTITNNTPVVIPTLAGTVNSQITHPGGTISDLNVTVQIAHTWVGDLDATLISPQGTSIELFNQPGVPASQYGCDGDNLSVVFDDQATNTANQLETACAVTAPAISGSYIPVAAFSGLNGLNAQGNWTLRVRDNVDQDGGTLNSWSLEVCTTGGANTVAVTTNNGLTVPQGQTATISTSLLSSSSTNGPAGSVRYMVLGPVANGTLNRNGVALGLGSTFTQSDIDNGLLSYAHSGNAGASDQFIFHVTETGGAGWVNAGTFQITILQNTLFASATLTQNISCYNQNNGVITVQAGSGNGALTYRLNGGAPQSSGVFSNLAGGTYTVTVTDAAGFSVTTNPITITNPPLLLIAASATNNQIDVMASGGTGTLLYSLNHGTPQSSNIFSNLANGVYDVIVTDANGCTQATQAVVAVNTLITGAAITSSISCFGGSNGTVTITIGGGQAPYTITLSNGTVQVGNGTFTNLPAGTYSATVTDSQGFTANTTTVTLTNPAQLSATASVNLNSITVTATGGTGNLQYALQNSPFQTSPVFDNLANNNYTILVQDVNGCQATVQATVAVAPLTIGAQATSGILCFGDLTGSISATAFGGIPPYNFRIDGGSNQISNFFTGLGAGTHTVEVFDAAGSSASTSVIITQPSMLNATASVNLDEATINATGGAGAYTYSLNGNVQNAPTFTNLANGTYTCVVTDANGCTTSLTVVVAVAPLTGSAAISGTIRCFGDQTLTLTVSNVSGGFPPYTYAINGGVPQTLPTFPDLGAGTYMVTITDINGQTITLNATGNANQPPQLAGTVNVNADSATVATTGGTPPYQYSLNGAANQTSPIFGGLLPNTYPGIVITDANGCQTSTAPFTILVGTQDLLDLYGLQIAPNPSAGTFHLRFAKQAESELLMRVMDITGRHVVLTQTIPQGASQATLHMEHLAAGTYQLIVTDQKATGSSILIIAR